MTHLPIRGAGSTHRGRVREANEDNIFVPHGLTAEQIQRSGYLFIAADGVGGSQGGKRASEIAVTRIPQLYYAGSNGHPEHDLVAALQGASRDIVNEAASNPALHGMGATVVAAALHDNTLTVAHLGDARAYRLRRGRLERLTRDHKWVDEQVTQGVLTQAEADTHPNRNIITRSLGDTAPQTPEVYRDALQPGDVILLCSDGLSDVVPDSALAEQLKRNQPLEKTAEALIELANHNGGPDNISVVLARAGGAPPPAGSKFPAWLLLLLIPLVFLLGWALFGNGGSGSPTSALPGTAIARTTTETVGGSGGGGDNGAGGQGAGGEPTVTLAAADLAATQAAMSEEDRDATATAAAEATANAAGVGQGLPETVATRTPPGGGQPAPASTQTPDWQATQTQQAQQNRPTATHTPRPANSATATRTHTPRPTNTVTLTPRPANSATATQPPAAPSTIRLKSSSCIEFQVGQVVRFEWERDGGKGENQEFVVEIRNGLRQRGGVAVGGPSWELNTWAPPLGVGQYEWRVVLEQAGRTVDQSTWGCLRLTQAQAQPTTPVPQPTTPVPQPTTPEPQPTTPEPEPTTPEPQPTTPEPEPSLVPIPPTPDPTE